MGTGAPPAVVRSACLRAALANGLGDCRILPPVQPGDPRRFNVVGYLIHRDSSFREDHSIDQDHRKLFVLQFRLVVVGEADGRSKVPAQYSLQKLILMCDRPPHGRASLRRSPRSAETIGWYVSYDFYLHRHVNTPLAINRIMTLFLYGNTFSAIRQFQSSPVSDKLCSIFSWQAGFWQSMAKANRVIERVV